MSARDNVCGICGLAWHNCECESTLRTESIQSLLSNEVMFPTEDKRHLCMFFYHSYQRYTLHIHDNEFSTACLPPWEGWYAGWLKPDNTPPYYVPWNENAVLDCTLMYPNGCYLKGYLDESGVLTALVGGPIPPSGNYYDVECQCVRTRINVSQALTLEEISSGRRGTVHGFRKPNSGRKISHIIGGKKEALEVLQLPNEHQERVRRNVETSQVLHFAKHLHDEFKWRSRRRYSKDVAIDVQRFLKALFGRAADMDDAVRFALGRMWRLNVAEPSVLLGVVSTELQTLMHESALVTEERQAEDDRMGE